MALSARAAAEEYLDTTMQPPFNLEDVITIGNTGFALVEAPGIGSFSLHLLRYDGEWEVVEEMDEEDYSDFRMEIH